MQLLEHSLYYSDKWDPCTHPSRKGIEWFKAYYQLYNGMRNCPIRKKYAATKNYLLR